MAPINDEPTLGRDFPTERQAPRRIALFIVKRAAGALDAGIALSRNAILLRRLHDAEQRVLARHVEKAAVAVDAAPRLALGAVLGAARRDCDRIAGERQERHRLPQDGGPGRKRPALDLDREAGIRAVDERDHMAGWRSGRRVVCDRVQHAAVGTARLRECRLPS